MIPWTPHPQWSTVWEHHDMGLLPCNWYWSNTHHQGKHIRGKGILEENFISSAKKPNLGRRWMFQQDNNRSHQSPDLNLIENLHSFKIWNWSVRGNLITLWDQRQFPKRNRPKLNHKEVEVYKITKKKCLNNYFFKGLLRD